MTSILFEPLLRKTAIQAIDDIASRVAGAEIAQTASVARILDSWRRLDAPEKERVVTTMIAVGSAAIAAIVALKSRTRRPAKAKKRARKS